MGFLYCLTFLILLFLIAWFVVTQPLLPGRRAGQSPSSAWVDPARLEAHVRMLAETLLPRDAGHPQNLDRVAAYIASEFGRTGGRLFEQTYQVEARTYRNVLLHLGPETEERVVIGAHYDAFAELPGADDNASAVAGLIELAHLLDGAPLSTTVELVAYTLEEPPYFRSQRMGSAVHARSLRKQDIPVRLMISLEMIGYFSDAPNSQQYPFPFLHLFYPSRGNAIAVIGKLDGGRDVRRVKRPMHRATALPVYSFNGPRGLVTGLDMSDHLSYWRYGYPAVMVTDTAFLRNPAYHTEHDTPDRLDYERMAMVVVGVYEAVLELAK
jgi:hypothetical protein